MDLKTLQTIQTEVDDLLDRLDVTFMDAEVSMDEKETIKVELRQNEEGEEDNNVGLLIGSHGETLLALEYIIALIINQDKDEWLHVAVDVDGYRKRREEDLRELAMKMADKAMFLSKEVELRPMPSKDRRIVHMALSEVPGVTTESAGEGRSRRVVVKPVE